jgi:hypothetical protein
MSLLDDVSLMITPNGVAEDVLFGVLPQPIIGVELITNGDFATDSDWDKLNGSTISDGVGNVVANGNLSTTGANWGLTQDNVFTPSTPYMIKFRARQTSGSGKFQVGYSYGYILNQVITSGFVDYSINFTTNASGWNNLVFGGETIGDTFEVDNVSVKEYTSADMDFTRETTATRSAYTVDVVTNGDFATGDLSGWSAHADGGAGGITPVYTTVNGVAGVRIATTSSGNSYIKQEVMASGSSYKVSYTILENNNGTLSLEDDTGDAIPSTVGSHIVYYDFVDTDSFLTIRRSTGVTDIVITNISVKELLIEDVPRNLLKYSQDFNPNNGAYSTSNSPSLTYNIATAPNGTKTADGIQAEDATNYKRINQVFTVTPNSTHTFSIFVKKETSETNFGGIGMTYSLSSTKTTYAIINAVDGTIVDGGGTLTPTFNVQDFGTYWRFEMKSTDNASNTLLECAYYGTLSINGTSLSTGVGSVRTIWGAQLEIGSQATTYIPTTDRLNVPRIDYTGGGCPHILAEPQRINICLQSQTINDAAWVKSVSGTGITPVVTANNVISPDGTQNAEKVVFDLNGGTSSGDFSYLYQTYTQTADTYSLSCYLKGASGGENIFLDFDTQNTNTVTLTADWVRYTFTKAVTNTGSRVIRIGVRGGVTSSDNPTVYMWGCQLELGSYPTSYIPTVAASVTRNEELFTRTGIGDLINSAEGVLYIEMAALSNDGTTRQISLCDGTNTNRVTIGFSSSGDNLTLQVTSGGSFQMNQSQALTQINYNKIALKYKVNDFAVWLNGTEVITDTSGSAPIGLNSLKFDRGDGANNFRGKVRNLQVYKTALSDTQLDDLTS